MKELILIGFALLFGVFVFAGNGNQLQADVLLQKQDQLFFIENKGQWHNDVLYLCRLGSLDAWITKYGVNYTFYKIEKDPAKHSSEENEIVNRKFKSEQENEILLGHRVLLQYENHNPNPATEGSQKQSGYYNYFIGNDAGKHASKVGLYKEVMVKDVYHGIDIRYYFDRGCLRYDYFVQPGADPGQIKFELTGAYDEYLKAGDLCYTMRFGEVLIAELKSLQENKEVASRFVRTGKSWQLLLGTYNTTLPLIIDPLVYSTYIGGGSDKGKSIALDASGNAYITGYTYSTDYDITPGAFQTTNGGLTDVIVTKLNSTGTDLLYSTYIGGSGLDQGYSIALDTSGNAYITGLTTSTDYDITMNAFQTTNEGDIDVFVTKINSTGNALMYSTYIGGSSEDKGRSIALDALGNAYITGDTESTNYDISPGAFQTTNGGLNDVFVTKLNSTGTALLYSTYIGGSSYDSYNSIVLDTLGNAYITGQTSSTDYDITPDSFQATLGGITDVFVTKLNSTGTALLYSTYIGGSMADMGYSIVLDALGNAYITGETRSNDYDISPGAFQTTCDGWEDIFVTKLNSTGTALLYSTYIGGSYRDFGYGIALDASGNVSITGLTYSTDYDISPGAFQTTNDGYTDVFVTKLNSTGTALLYSTYIGGSGEDGGYSIALDVSGNSYITGFTQSTDYDISPGAFQPIIGGTFGGNTNLFITKLALCLEAPAQPSAISGNATPCEAAIETYSVALVDGVTYTWTLPTDWTQTGGGTSNAITVTVGAGSGNITVTPSNGCGIGTAQTLAVAPTSLPAQPGAITGSTAPCEGTSQSYSITNMTGITYNWTFPIGWTQTGGGTTNSVTVTVGANNGEITVTPSIACGNGTAQTLDVTPEPFPAQPSAISGNATPCEAETETYSVTIVDSVSYTWTFPADWTQTGGGNTNSVTVTVGPGSGNITCTPSNECGNGTAQTLAVASTTLPAQPSIINGSTIPCQGSSQSYSVTNVDGVTYTWIIPADWTQTGGGTTNAISATVGAESGNITVTPSNECGNGTAQTLAVAPTPLPAQPGAITGSTAPCEGTSQNYNVTNVDGVTYTWTFPAGWTQTGGGTTNSVTITVGSESGNITVTPSNECGNGASSPFLSITVASTPPTPVITYHGDTLTSSLITGNQWYKDGVAISGATNQNYVTAETGAYTVVVTINGCSSERSAPFIITSITNNINELNTLLIQPNPNIGKFKLTAEVARRQVCTLEIITNTGVTIYKVSGLVLDGKFSKEVDIAGASAGDYMVVLRNSENQVIRKMIITH